MIIRTTTTTTTTTSRLIIAIQQHRLLSLSSSVVGEYRQQRRPRRVAAACSSSSSSSSSTSIFQQAVQATSTSNKNTTTRQQQQHLFSSSPTSSSSSSSKNNTNKAIITRTITSTSSTTNNNNNNNEDTTTRTNKNSSSSSSSDERSTRTSSTTSTNSSSSSSNNKNDGSTTTITWNAEIHTDDDTAKKKSTESSSESVSSTKQQPSHSQEQPASSSKKQQQQQQQQPPVPLLLTFADISRASVAIRGGIKRTVCERSHFLSELVGSNLYFKNEFKQFTGSFKERGARNAILTLMNQYNKKQQNKKQSNSQSLLRGGVIAASAGNHALALAYHGQELGIPVTVVMPTVAPMAKVDKCRKFGAHVIIEGNDIGEAKTYAEQLVSKKEQDGCGLLHYINGYDDLPILAGAGTIGMEIIDDIPDVDIVIIPVGGAGLIAGVSCAIKTLKPDTVVIGVEPEYCASYTAAIQAGYPIRPDNFQSTLADGLAVPIVGSQAFHVARQYVDECVLTTEKDISLAVLRLVENEKIVVEGGGATGLAALLPGGPLDRLDMKNKNIVIPLCGGNIDTTVLGRVLERGLASDKRLVNFIATVSDRPGGISKLTNLLSTYGASIKDIYHERAWLHSSVDQVQVKCVIELQGIEHGIKVKDALIHNGYSIVWNTDEG